MEELTFTDWTARGRAVRAGQHASAYLVSPDLSQAVALFLESQTEPADIARSYGGWFRMPAEQWREIKAERARPKPTIKVRTRLIPQEGSDTVIDFTEVWVGRNSEAGEWLKWAGFRFDMATHRWAKYSDDGETHQAVIDKFEGTGKYTVVIE